MKCITLEEGIRKNIINVGDFFEYTPEYGRCILTSQETGYGLFPNFMKYTFNSGRPQIFETEELTWQLEMYEGKPILLADKVKQYLCLKGEIGYTNGIEILNRVCKTLYSNKSISKNAGSIFKEIWKNWKDNRHISSVYHSEYVSNYWLSSKNSHWTGRLSKDDRSYYSLDVAFENEIVQYVLYDSKNNSYEGRSGIRPVIYLKDNLKVKMRGEEKPWKINPLWEFVY